MTTPPPTGPWRLVDVPPGPFESPTGWMFHAIADFDRLVSVRTYGHADLHTQPASNYQRELTPSGPDDKRWVAKRWVLALDAEAADALPPGSDLSMAVVGRAAVHTHTTAALDQAWCRILVHPDRRGQGIGTLLLEWVESVAAEQGRTVVQTGVGFSAPDADADADAPQVTPAHGRGAVPLTPDVRFALAHGYEIEQVERQSLLELPVDPELLRRLGEGAREHASGYRFHTWHGPVPDEWLDAYALLETRMSTDTPAGGMARETDVWDAERVRREEGNLRASGLDWLITCAEHVETGELAGTTRLAFPPFWYAPCAYQFDTIVVAQHRGRRLGMAMKVANLEALADLRPGTLRVHTGNAEENDHMLAINVALGFRPAGGHAALQKVTTV